MTADLTARELLEAAWFEVPSRIGPHENVGQAMAATPSGAELLRRADEPRVAEGLVGGGPYHAGDSPASISHRLPQGTVAYLVAVPESWDLTNGDRLTLPAPRPPEPDRTAALRGLVVAWSSKAAALRITRSERHIGQAIGLAEAANALDEAIRVLAATPEPAPVADGRIPPLCRCGGSGWTMECPVHDLPTPDADGTVEG